MICRNRCCRVWSVSDASPAGQLRFAQPMQLRRSHRIASNRPQRAPDVNRPRHDAAPTKANQLGHATQWHDHWMDAREVDRVDLLRWGGGCCSSPAVHANSGLPQCGVPFIRHREVSTPILPPESFHLLHSYVMPEEHLIDFGVAIVAFRVVDE
jgi:hypothetical protein